VPVQTKRLHSLAAGHIAKGTRQGTREMISKWGDLGEGSEALPYSGGWGGEKWRESSTEGDAQCKGGGDSGRPLLVRGCGEIREKKRMSTKSRLIEGT